jgi:predicted nucleic acid-binding protein
MSDRTFVDTNVLVYALDDAEPEKRDIAREVLGSGEYGELVLSAQVLSELYVAITRRLARPVPEEQAIEVVERLGLFNATVSIDAALVRLGMQTSRSAQLSYWDGLVVAAAQQAGCSRLLTEDLNDGQLIGSVRVENPFRDR